MAGYDGSIKIDTRVNSDGFNRGIKGINNGLNSVIGSLKKVAIAVGIAFGIKAIIDFGKSSLQAVTDLENALMGLRSVVEGQGRSFSQAKDFISDYISDGLVPATNAITAYKNLLLRGYDDSQIQAVMQALKDSAAFGRQSSYTLGEAVQTATEGLKNENSLLVDNAGVTKNVAAMWRDYAASIGTTANNLTKQQKIQAEVMGILEETKYQIGDAALIADSFSGKVLQLQFAFQDLKIAVGKAIKPIVSAVIPHLKALINWFTILANKIAQITALLFGKTVTVNNKTAESANNAATATSELADATTDAGKAAEKAGKKAKGALANFDELNVLSQDTSSGSGAEASGVDTGGGLSSDVISEDIGEGVEVSPKLLESINRLKELLTPTIEALKELWEQLKIIGGFAWDALKDFYEHFLKPVGEWLFGEDSGLARFINIIREGLEKIDWQKINDALIKLWEALAPFVINIGDGLLWFLENVLVPLGVWAMNNIVPLAIEGIANAIQILNGIIESLKPLGVWLWETFLEPLAEWTGGIIADVLKSIVDELGDFATWIENNQGEIRKITVEVVAFFTAWKVAKLLAFIQTSGGVISTLGLIGKAIVGATLAKIADKAETAALTLMYAKDFIVALAKGTVELIKQAAQWVINTALKVADTVAQVAMNVATTAWNALAAISATVTTAFGAAIAFLTSPIGLVIIAIGALIAIVVLLATHWDEVKQVAKATWDNMKEVWKVVSTWFSEKVVTPVVNFFSGLWDTIFIKASEAWANIKEVFINAGVWFNEHVITPIHDKLKSGINKMIGFVEGFVNKIIKGVNFIISAINSISIDIPDWVPGIGGSSLSPNLSTVGEIRIPKLATGAVIPPNQEFMAILGDQKSGRNLEAPEGLIRQIIREELSGLETGGKDINIAFEGNLAQLARVLNPVIKKEEKRTGGTLRIGGAY